MTEQLIYNQMPEHYLLCYSTECPLADGCLRRLGAIHRQTSDKIVQAVNPHHSNAMTATAPTTAP